VTSFTRDRPSTARRLGLGVLLAALCAFFVAAPTAAFAHDELIGSSPADGDVVDASPTSIDLRFSAEPLAGDGATEVLVIDPSGREVQDGDPVLDRNGVIQNISGAEEPGTYRVIWRIVSSDGHPISGEVLFSVDEPSEPAPVPTASEAGDAGDESGAFDATPLWVVGGLIVVGLGGALVAVLVARARRSNGGV